MHSQRCISSRNLGRSASTLEFSQPRVFPRKTMLITALGVFHVLHSRIYRLQREITVFNEERFILLERFSAFQIDRSDRRTGVWIIAGVDRASFTFVHSGDWRITATVWKSSLLVTDRFLTVTSRREIEFLSFRGRKIFANIYYILHVILEFLSSHNCDRIFQRSLFLRRVSQDSFHRSYVNTKASLTFLPDFPRSLLQITEISRIIAPFEI